MLFHTFYIVKHYLSIEIASNITNNLSRSLHKNLSFGYGVTENFDDSVKTISIEIMIISVALL